MYKALKVEVYSNILKMLIKMNSDNKKRGKAWKCEN